MLIYYKTIHVHKVAYRRYEVWVNFVQLTPWEGSSLQAARLYINVLHELWALEDVLKAIR